VTIERGLRRVVLALSLGAAVASVWIVANSQSAPYPFSLIDWRPPFWLALLITGLYVLVAGTGVWAAFFFLRWIVMGFRGVPR
jgi:hypothetical protein